MAFLYEGSGCAAFGTLSVLLAPFIDLIVVIWKVGRVALAL